ncbi:RraA family protein [Frateuria defendens]|uniref:RraA family protein n=1 Tax=Frateuria defendens TaxID=2219559 RepID=UPI00066FEFC9|nr:RraA family protein [Frateuria defendens]
MDQLPRYRLNAHPDPLPEALVHALGRVETSTLGHGVPWHLMARAIRPLDPGQRLVGTAVTLAIPGADSTLLHHVLAGLRPGDVLVIDRLGDTRHACWGGIVTAAAQRAGIAGAIIDGPCTDLPEIRASGFPLWCTGTSPVTTRLLDWGGRLNAPVACGGIVVAPGDAIVADADGVLALPRGEALAAAEWALGVQAFAADLLAGVRQGQALGDLSGASRLVRAGCRAGHAH